MIIRNCSENSNINKKTVAYYDEAVKISVHRLPPLTCYYHMDPRPDKLAATALTGVQPYMGNRIPNLKGSVVFTDLAQDREIKKTVRGALACARARTDCKMDELSIIETDYDFGSQSAFYVSLGANLNQTRLFLGVYGSMNVTSYNQGTVFEIVP